MNSMRDDDRPELEAPLLQGLGQAVPQVDPPLDLRARVLRAATAQPQSRTVEDTEPRGHEDTRDQPRRHEGTKDQPRRHEGTKILPWLAAAASLVLAAGLTIYTAQLRGRIVALEGELRETRARADASERQMADAERAAAGAQSAVMVLSAPDVARVDLAGQPAAPQASARAYWSRSRGMVFTASNLPPLPAGRIYQLWVVSAQPPISAGLLTPDAQGSVNETIATDPNIPQPVALAVTIEPAGGVPAPTGERYLVGTL